jgi:DNA repair exonuclease SbcCD ATPase subunit
MILSVNEILEGCIKNLMTSEIKTSAPETKQEAKQEKPSSPVLQELSVELEKTASREEKIQKCLAVMRAALSEKAVRFKDYWEAKRLCLPLFKEALAAPVRSTLWIQYVEISTEARHLKETLDEQSAFAMEQIDLAIQAIETDLAKMDELIAQTSEWAIPDQCETLRHKKEFYTTLQRELDLLNTLASRVNSFRKEVIRTEMRIRFKNKFFDRLSKAGDQIFPRRKELIRQISTQFLSDVKLFALKCQTKEMSKDLSIFVLRDEIKFLQILAKEMTLDTRAFTETRLELSKCWDFLKECDKERKKEMAEKKESFKKNVELIMDKIRPLAQRCGVETFTMDEAMKQSSEILSFMKTIELGRDEVHFLKDEIAKARTPVYERERKVQLAREKEIEESQRQRLGKIEDFKRRLQETCDQVSEKSIEELLSSKDELGKQLSVLAATHAEKELLEHSLKELRDRIIDKKEKAVASLSDEERNSLQHLKQRLEEWKAQKQEIRMQLETYRRALAGSGFDFEKAMRYRELMNEEKVRLDKANHAIEEIETKIEAVENV